MKKIKDLAVVVGKYQKDGQEKNRYLNVGAVFEKDGNKFILLSRTFNPAGVPGNADKDSVLISMFDVRDDSNISAQPQQSTEADDDIPF